MAAATPKAGDVLGGRYVLRECIGEGGMGSVYLADQPALARTVAIKILHARFAADRELARRLREEAVAASRVRHPGSVAVIDCNQLPDGTPYIVMEHVEGRALGRVIASDEISIDRAIDLTLQILAVVDAAHHSGVVHADLKSDNFLLVQDAGADRIKLIDFGLARLDDEAERRKPVLGPFVSGTPEYMSPEVILGDPPERASDLYAIGVILYEMLTGATPFGGGKAGEIMARHLEDIVVPPSVRVPDRDIPLQLDNVVLRALAKLPEHRFRDVAAFARAVRAAGLQPRTTTNRMHRVDTASAESPTRNGVVPLTRPRLARGSEHRRPQRAEHIDTPFRV